MQLRIYALTRPVWPMNVVPFKRLWGVDYDHTKFFYLGNQIDMSVWEELNKHTDVELIELEIDDKPFIILMKAEGFELKQ